MFLINNAGIGIISKTVEKSSLKVEQTLRNESVRRFLRCHRDSDETARRRVISLTVLYWLTGQTRIENGGLLTLPNSKRTDLSVDAENSRSNIVTAIHRAASTLFFRRQWTSKRKIVQRYSRKISCGNNLLDAGPERAPRQNQGLTDPPA